MRINGILLFIVIHIYTIFSVVLGSSSRSSKSKRKEDASNEESSDSESGRERSLHSKDDTPCVPVIRDLGSAILQLEQSLEPKFLKRPLGGDYFFILLLYY